MSSTPWLTTTPASVTRKNITSVISDTGANLATYDKTKFKIVTCTATGSGFTLNHAYLFGGDGTTVVDLGLVADHTHTSTGDGGDIAYIYTNNPEKLDLLLIKPTDLIKANWNQAVTGTGTIEDSTFLGAAKQYIRLRPNGTSGSGATISYLSAVNLTYGLPSKFVCTGNFETATSLAFHAGVNADDVTAADSNNSKYQAEVCTATNQNWWLRTADGAATSAGDTGVAINTGDTSLSIFHDPLLGTPKAILEIDAANAFTKTTNIPASNSNVTGNIIKFSIKNNTGADRPYRFKGARLTYSTTDSWGYG